MISMTFTQTYQGNFEADVNAQVSTRAYAAMVKIMLLLERGIKRWLSHPGSGRLYPSKLNYSVKHRASAPGEPPAPDTGRYRASIQTRVDQTADLIQGSVGSLLWTVFGRRLELGGTGGGAYIAPRPHIRPAWDESANEIQDILDHM